MPLGRLAGLVASMPSGVPLIVNQDELDLTPPAGSGQFQQPQAQGLVAALETHVASARKALMGTNDNSLLTTNWRLKAGGKIVSDGLAAAAPALTGGSPNPPQPKRPRRRRGRRNGNGI